MDFDALITHNRFTLVNRNAEPMIDPRQDEGDRGAQRGALCGRRSRQGVSRLPRYVYQEASDAALEPVRRIEAICARHGVPVGAAALQFSMRDPRVTSTICGVTRPERVTQTLEWARFPIPAGAWEELNAIPFATDDPEATRDYKPG